MKDIVYYHLMKAAGAFATRTLRLAGTVFCFHSVTSSSAAALRESSLSVSDEFIRLLITRLRQLNIPIVSINEAVERRRSGNRSPFAALTFDDGYGDNGEILHPLMEREQVPYTIFVTSALIDGTMPLWWDSIERLVYDQTYVLLDGETVLLPAGQKEKVLLQLGTAFKRLDLAGQRTLLEAIADANPALNAFKPYDCCLSWSRLREMNASPYLTVGAHTRTHPLLVQLTPVEIRDELTCSKEQIEDEVGCAVEYLAYPFGQPFEYGSDAPMIAQQIGYKAAFTTSHGDWIDPNSGLFHLPRVLIANKAKDPDIALAYMSSLPRRLKNALGAIR